MPFEYRLRFHLLPEDRIASASPRIELPDAAAHLRLQSSNRDAPVNATPRLILIGGPFDCADNAAQDGLRAKRALLLWALQRRVAVDFGDGRKRGGLTETGAELLARTLGGPVRDSVHGLDVYEAFDNQRFVTIEANLGSQLAPEPTANSIASWYTANVPLSEKQELAIELYCAAHFDAPFRSRFLTLMTSIEALLDHQPRPDDVRRLVMDLEAAVKASSLPKSDKQSLCSSLRWLHRESIGQAGRRMAATLLPNAVYGGVSAAVYFRTCYDLRSTIVHSGRVPPEIDLLTVSNELWAFVGDLLQAALGVPAT